MFLKLLFLAVVLLLLLIVVPFLYIVSQILLIRWKYRHLPSPKVKSFILGHATDFLEIEKSGGHYSMLVVDWKKQHGSVFALYLVNRVTVMCLEPNLVKDLLITHYLDTVKPKDYYGLFQKVFGDSFLGDGLFTQLDNVQWAKQRHALNPAFKRGCLKNLMPQYNDSTNALINLLKLKADGKQIIHLVTELSKLTLDIIARVAFGIDDLNVIVEEDTPFAEASAEALHGVMMQLKMSFLSRIDPRQKMKKERDAIRNSNKLIRDRGRDCIMERLQDMRDGKDYPQDMLTLILQNYISGQKIKEEEMELMLDEFSTLFVAGSETTTHLLAFTFEIVGRRPNIYKKIKEEVDRVIGDKDFISYDDTTKLEYMNLVFKESLRFFPPVLAVQRGNVDDLFINGLKIPAGSSIELNNYALSRDERFWDEPEKFYPERFRSDMDRNLYAYFPFSLGPRVCIGQHFSLISAKAIMAKMFQTFNFDLVPGVEIEYLHEGSVKSKNKTPMYLTLRKE